MTSESHGVRPWRVLAAIAFVLAATWATFALLRSNTTEDSTHADTQPVDTESNPLLTGNRIMHVEREEVPAGDEEPETDERARVEIVECVIRDLSNGEALSDLELTLISKDADDSRTVVSDRNGVARIPWSSGLKVRLSHSQWKASWQERAPFRKVDTLWVYRTNLIRGNVRAHDDADEVLDGSTVRLTLCMLGKKSGGSGPVDTGAPPPWNTRWADAHGLWDRASGAKVDEDGSYVIDAAPVVPGLIVRALAPGWLPAWVEVRADSGGAREISAPEIVMRRSVKISGTITDSYGKPIASPRLRAYVTQKVSSKGEKVPFDMARARLVGVAFTAGGGKDGSAVTFIKEIKVAKDGTFAFELSTLGEVLVVAESAKHVTSRVELDVLQDDPDPLELKLKDFSGPAIRFEENGKPLPSWKCVLDDIMKDTTGMAPNITWSGYLSAESEVPGVLMERDRDYHVFLMSPDRSKRYNFFVRNWDGSSILEVTAHSSK